MNKSVRKPKRMLFFQDNNKEFEVLIGFGRTNYERYFIY